MMFCAILLLTLLFCSSRAQHCGNIFTDKQFVLTSENYPQPYPPDKTCFYLLKGGNCTTHYDIEFLDFNLTSSVGCTKDRLEIGSQDALCGTKSGSKVYISEKGSLKLKFLSDNDPEKNNRGFKMLVTRVDDCEPDNSTLEDAFTVENRNIDEDSTEPVEFEWTTKTPPTKPRPTYLPPPIQPCCQNNIFASKTFTLMSPNFPFSISAPTDCTYIVRKASSLVCRLRINILFFTLGLTVRNSCPNGYLEIDGKRICGCNSDLQLTTDFRNSESKLFRFFSPGSRTRDISGFVLEINQDECQKKYSPEDGVLAEKSRGKFKFYNDQSNRINWPYTNNIDQLKLVKEKSLYLPSKDNEIDSQFGNIFKQFYFFAPEEEEDISWTRTEEDREETNYIDIATVNNVLTESNNYQPCRNWNSNQFSLLQEKFGSDLYQMCQLSQKNSDEETNCYVLGSLSGRFTSPGYPTGYAASKNICYRFKMSPGHCAVQIMFTDFEVEQSYDCLKDYLTIDRYRYCGNYLSNKRVTIAVKGKPHQDLKFVSDSNYCAKGFSAIYQQVRCQKPGENSITPINCNPGGKAAADGNPISCGKVISDKYFIIRSGYMTSGTCVYEITRFAETVCKVQFYFEYFNLPCELGSISINGKVICGQRTGESFKVDMLDVLQIFFRQNKRFTFTPNIGFSILGDQIDRECDSFTPEPVRLISTSTNEVPFDSPNFRKNILYTEALIPEAIREKPALMNRASIIEVSSYPDICALINQNLTTQELPSKICDILTENYNATECNFSKAMIIDIPITNSTKIRLFNNDNSEKVDYKEINCGSS